MRAPAFARALLGLIAISGALFSADGQGHGGEGGEHTLSLSFFVFTLRTLTFHRSLPPSARSGVTDVVELLSVASDHIVSPAPSESQLGTVKRYNRFMHG